MEPTDHIADISKMGVGMKWFSRKLFVLILASVLVFFTKIDGWVWLFVSLAYIGGNLIDKLIELKGGNNVSKSRISHS